jgi:hypothetical protein
MAAKKKAKTAHELRKEALQAIQKLVRLIESDANGYCTCVTCGVTKKWNKGMQGGHFIPKKASKYWALEIDNIHPQCAYCNQYAMPFGIAAHKYTIYMQKLYSTEVVDQMLADIKKPQKLCPADYREMIEDFNERIDRQLERIGQ